MKQIKFIIVLLLLGIVQFTEAQNTGFNLGVQMGNIYDIDKGPIEQSNGYSDVDLKGLKGDYAKFDLGYGLSASLDLKKRFALDLDILFGQMSGQSDYQYYESKLNMFDIGFRTYFRPFETSSRINGYLTFRLGLTHYDANRYFVLDQGLFSKTKGLGFNNELEVGALITLSNSFKAQVSSGVLYTYSDALDGYDNQKLGDPVLRTKIALLYSFKTKDAKKENKENVEELKDEL